MSNALMKTRRWGGEPSPPAPPTPPEPPPRVEKVTVQRPVWSVVIVPLGNGWGPGTFNLSYVSNGITYRQTLNVPIKFWLDLKNQGLGFVYAVTGMQTTTETRIVKDSIPVELSKPRKPIVTLVPDAWDATARSALIEVDPLVVEFTIDPTGVSKVVGLSANATQPKNIVDWIIHGFKIDRGIAYLHQTPEPGVKAASYPHLRYFESMAVTDATVFKITVARGLVRYYVDDVLMASMPSMLAGRAASLRALLYNVEDIVYDPTIGPFVYGGEGEAVFRLGAIGSGDNGYSEGVAVLGRLDAVGSDLTGALAQMGPLYARGSSREQGFSGTANLPGLYAFGIAAHGNFAEGVAVLGRIAAIGAGAQGYSQGAAVFKLGAYGLSYDLGARQDHIVATDMLMDAAPATFPHGGLHAVAGVGVNFTATHVHPLRLDMKTGIRSRFRPGRLWDEQILMRAGVKMNHRAERVRDVALVIPMGASVQLLGVLVVTESLTIGTGARMPLTASGITDAALRMGVGAAAQLVANQELHAAIAAVMRAGVQVYEPGKNIEVWSVNKANSASASYEQFPFNSFARIGGRYFAAGDGGLYELTGDTDAGEPIRASLNLGKRNFGSSQLKRIPNCYMTVASTGQMVVRVTTPEGQSYMYETRRADDFMRVQRADFGKGLRAHYLGLEVFNQNGDDFDLEQLEFVVAELKRRI